MDVCGENQQVHADLGGVHAHCGQFVERVPDSVIQSLRRLDKLQRSRYFIFTSSGMATLSFASKSSDK